MLFGTQLPDFYQRFLPAKIWHAEITETKATCSDCLMAQKPYEKFSAQLKCCTYHPFLPNYLVGAILEDSSSSSAAKHRILKKIANHEFALPVGIVPSLGHQVSFNRRKDGEFGNRSDWLCPYYNHEQQNCGVWRHRGNVCTTFFCKSSFGRAGMEFWQRMGDYLSYIEMALLEMILVNLGFSPRQISKNLEYLNRYEASTVERHQQFLIPSQMQELWNGYETDMESFYRRCFEQVKNWTPHEYAEALGEQGKALHAEIVENLNKLTKSGSKKNAAKVARV